MACLTSNPGNADAACYGPLPAGRDSATGPHACAPGQVSTDYAPCNGGGYGTNTACLQSGICYQNPYTSPGS